MDYFSTSDFVSRTIWRVVRNFFERLWDTLSRVFSFSRINLPSFSADFDPTPVREFSLIKFFVIIIAVLFVVGIIYVWIQSLDLHKEDEEFYDKHFIKPKSENVQKTRWDMVQARFASTSDAEWRMGIIEADIMLDELFTRLGYPGETLAERMKHANPQNFPLIQYAWDVHRLRNRMAHHSFDHALTHQEAWRAYKKFEAIFRSADFI